MRSLRSRVIDDTNSSTTSTITNPEESSGAQEQGLSKRKARKVKHRKRVSADNDDEQPGKFVLLRNRKSVTAPHTQDDNPKNQSTDTQRSVNGAKSSRSGKRRKRKAKRSANENDLCPTFEHAVTSTILKPRKETKILAASAANQSVEKRSSDATVLPTINVVNTTFDAEMPESDAEIQFAVDETNGFITHASSTHSMDLQKNEACDSTHGGAAQAVSPATQVRLATNNSTFEVTQEPSRIDNGTYEIEDSFSNRTGVHKQTAPGHDGTVELDTSVNACSVRVNKTPYSNGGPKAEPHWSGWQQTAAKEYTCLDDVSDVDEIINISDDPVDLKQSVISVSGDEMSVSTVVRQSDGSVANLSGEWQVQDLTSGTHTCANTGPHSPLDAMDKSARKKWQKYPRNSHAANAILDQINSPLAPKDQRSARKSLVNPVRVLKGAVTQRCSTPLLSAAKKGPLAVSSRPAAAKSTAKSAAKRVAMPNFALIHQKAFDKMESLLEYSERKRQRAKLLLSANKSQHSVPTAVANKENAQKTSSRQLFAANSAKDRSRFGFKTRDVAPKPPSPPPVGKRGQGAFSVAAVKKSNLPKPKLIVPKSMMLPGPGVPGQREKAPILERKGILAIVNKNRGENGPKTRENQREQLKGVRTNRRFELLMKMRRNQ